MSKNCFGPSCIMSIRNHAHLCHLSPPGMTPRRSTYHVNEDRAMLRWWCCKDSGGIEVWI